MGTEDDPGSIEAVENSAASALSLVSFGAPNSWNNFNLCEVALVAMMEYSLNKIEFKRRKLNF
jgi:hypothetical protein